ncbi:sensor histidine kinase [Aquimarina macrocephali]|uniref:sensor histidine kinase n=1 Tax=Aquimarina macrocephali TaxID=666563 RepID=UPI0004637A37|nr:sensor histidine kinase [Aquimarina macrocephali]
MKKYPLLCICLLFLSFVRSSAKDINHLQTYFDLIINLEYEKAKIKANDITSGILKEDLIILSNLLFYNGQEKIKPKISYRDQISDPFQKCINYLNIGYDRLYHNKDRTTVIESFYNAYTFAKETKRPYLIKFCLLSILELYHYEYSQTNKQFENYLLEYKRLAKTPIEKCWAFKYEIYFDYQAIPNDDDDSFLLTNELEEQVQLLNKNHRFRPLFYSLKAIQLELEKKTLEATKLHQKVLIETSDVPFLKYLKFRTHIRLSEIYRKQKKYSTGLKHIDIAKKFVDISDSLRSKIYIYNYASLNNEGLGNYFLALKQRDSSTILEQQLSIQKNTLQNSAMEIKLRTAEKEKEIVQLLNTNLKTEASRVQNRNLLIGSLSLILVGSIFVFLVYKNTKRKQRIAKQEREIEIQKTEKLLKEQELTAIDAMISGQEKERQRLANELHDNLGSTLATVKLHFQHLQHNKDNPKLEHVEELYTKTNALLDEAYQKVRTIAHEKNSGVMANQGLLPAVKKLAKKVGNGDALHIEVQDYGLEERLDNALEISIFRMIQELITNAIKHAEASEIHISLTNHDSLLNIIIEDNGRGFDAKVLPQKEGMGLRNIEKRVEHLQGTFEIDSTIEKGTNIIINIPI